MSDFLKLPCVISSTEVLIVFCDVPEEDTDITRCMLPLLSHDERERAMRFRFGCDRVSYSCAHLLLRRCLAQITQEFDWIFEQNFHGKPKLISASGSPPLAFNISHTRGWVACAFVRGHEVGVDVQTSRESIDCAELAKHNFSAREQQFLLDRTPTDLATMFYKIWTMKEAVIKAIGLGLQFPLDQFSVGIDNSSVRFAPVLSEDEILWHLASLREDDAWLAAAIRNSPSIAACRNFRWQRIDYETLLYNAPTWGP